MARATKEQAARTGAEIKMQARRALADASYGALALDAVAVAAGVTRGAVYHHFASKEGLFRAVLEDEMRHLAGVIEHAAGAGSEPWEQIRRGARAFLAATRDPVTRRIVLEEGPAVLGWAAWRDLDARLVRHTLDDGLRQLADAGHLRVDWSAAAIMLSGALNEAAFWLAGEDGADFDAALAVVDAWIDGCRS